MRCFPGTDILNTYNIAEVRKPFCIARNMDFAQRLYIAGAGWGRRGEEHLKIDQPWTDINF